MIETPPGAPPPRPTSHIVALVLACLVIVPLAPLVGCVMGFVIALRTPRGRPRGFAVLAAAIGAGVFALLQVAPTLLIVSVTRAFMKDLRFAEAYLNVPKVANQVQSYAHVNHRFPPQTDWSPPGDPRCPLKTHFAGNDPVWDQSPWRELRFHIPGAHGWQYRVALTGEPTSRWAEARADLDCHGDVRVVRVKVRENDRDELETVKE
jgi:hypothetical protein